MNDYKTIGLRLKQAREEKEYTLQQIADIVEMSKSTISRYENGKVENMNTPTIQKLSKIYGVNPMWVLGKSDIKETDNTDHIQINEIPKNYFTSANEAIEFLLSQNVIMAYTGVDIDTLSDDEKIQFANRLLDYTKLLGYDYKND